jgi:hypothetical protein
MNKTEQHETERSLLHDTRAVVYVEYIGLLSLVTLGGALSVYAVGAPLLQTFRYAQLIVSLPIP